MARVFVCLRQINALKFIKRFPQRRHFSDHRLLPGIGLQTVNSFPAFSSYRWCSSFPKYSQRVAGSGHGEDYLDFETRNKNEQALGKLNRRHREEATTEHMVSESSSFADFPLEPSLIQALEELGYKTPFEIQSKTLGHTLIGNDVIGRAVTGSGKTLAFAIPIVHKIKQSPRERGSRSPRAIVVAPTRELCNQIFRSIQEIDPRVRCVALYGGDSYIRQEREIHRGVDVVCATPGRLNDHLERGTINLQQLQFLCLDEADELLNPNFREQIEDLFENSPKTKQVFMFSATMPPEIHEIAVRYMNNPKYIDIANDSNVEAPLNIEHQCIRAPSNHNIPIVANLISQHNAERCIVFLRTKAYTNIVASGLRRLGLQTEALHSDLSQSRREKILSSFRLGDLKVLCATDVAARGLDIPEVDLVVQVEPPANGLEYYIHRSGRTGRAGRKGLSVLLHSGTPEEIRAIREISRKVKMLHVPAPENAINDVQERNLKKAVEKLHLVSEKEREKMMPLAEELMSNENSGTSVLASALVLLSQASTDWSLSSRQQHSTFENIHQSKPRFFTSGNKKFTRLPQRNKSIWYDEDDGGL